MGEACASHVITVESPNKVKRCDLVNSGALGATPDNGAVESMHF